MKLPSFSDTFELLNRINTSLQGNGECILTSADEISALADETNIWNRKAKGEHVEMFSC
jgi:hypothetical protein